MNRPIVTDLFQTARAGRSKVAAAAWLRVSAEVFRILDQNAEKRGRYDDLLSEIEMEARCLEASAIPSEVRRAS